MTQRQSAPVAAGDEFLRRGRELLAKGELAPASEKGWQAAVSAVNAYVGANGLGGDFEKIALELAKDHRKHWNTAEWLVSAMALRDNTLYDWLDRDNIGRRLDDVQRLVILVKDMADPPQNAVDILGRAWECMDNGYLAPAADKGWEAAQAAVKTYAHAIGYDYHGGKDFDKVIDMIEKKGDAGDREVSGWAYAAANLPQTAAYCAARPRRYAEIIAGDLGDVGQLVALIETRLIGKN